MQVASAHVTQLQQPFSHERASVGIEEVTLSNRKRSGGGLHALREGNSRLYRLLRGYAPNPSNHCTAWVLPPSLSACLLVG